MDLQHERAVRILGPIWRGIPSDYKTKYALNIWTQFENQVRSASYTTYLARFADKLSSRFGVAIADRDVSMLTEAIGAGDDAVLLRLFREEATYLVLLVREENDKRREIWKEKQNANARL